MKMWLALSLSVLMTACSGTYEDDGEDRSEELVKVIKNIEGNADDIILPNAEEWFSAKFGEEKGKALAKQYTSRTKDVSNLEKFFAVLKKKGRTEITAFRVNDETATGSQKRALKEAKTKLGLYTVQFTEPGKSRGTTLWSFIYDGDQFRLVGKMQALRAE